MDVLAFRQSERNLAGRLFNGVRHGNMDSTFDFPYVFRVGVDSSLIAIAEVFL
jgi:hypothetical protein